MHRARKEAEAPAGDAEAPPEPLPTSSRARTFFYGEPSDGESVFIGTWTPDLSQWPEGTGVAFVVHTTDDLETAELWRAALSAGRLPGEHRERTLRAGPR